MRKNKTAQKSIISRLGVFDRYNLAFILTSVIPLAILAFIVLTYVTPFLQTHHNPMAIISITILMFFLVFLAILGFFVSRAATAETLDKVHKYNERLTYLFEVAQSLSQQTHLDMLLEDIVKKAIETTGASAGIVLILDEQTNRLRFEVSIGTGAIAYKDLPRGAGVAGWVAEHGESLIVNNIETESRYQRDLNVFPNFDTSAILAAPLGSRSRTCGVLELLHRNNLSEFSEEDASILKSLASQATIFIDNIRYHDEQQNYFSHITEILISSLDGTRQFWKDHLRNTAKNAYLIGKKLNLSDQEMKQLHYASLLHDIGFIKLNLKEGKVWKNIEKHPEIGYEIIQPIAVWKDLAPIIRHHHEKYNGTGYPLRLSGDEIPLASRILAVAEAYDAMTNPYSYRPEKLSPETAVEELKRAAGIQFDPKIVQAFSESIL